jgi:RNA polymerase sigma factor (sigma-70 family)
MPITLVIADSHPIVLEGMERLFGQEADFRLAARCTGGPETLEAIRKHRPDVVVLDTRLPGKDGLTITREVQSLKLPPKIVLFTAELGEEQMLEAVHAGVRGIVLKEMRSELLVQCIRKVHAGEHWLDRRSSSVAIEKMLRREAGAYEIASVTTPREMHIIRLTAQGLPNREIAEKLCISEGTVKVHLHNIYDKLQLDSRLALQRYAREKRLV